MSYASDYREELKRLRKQQDSYKKRLSTIRSTSERNRLENEIKIINGMISSTEYSLFWIEVGHERKAGEKRPITNLSKEKRTQLWGDIEHSKRLSSEAPRTLTEVEKELIDCVLGLMTEDEREAYVSIYGKGNTYAETAEYMNVARSTVQRYIERAVKKVENQTKFIA